MSIPTEPKPKAKRRRHNQTVRLCEATREALAKEAEKNQRSLSEEMEFRLEMQLYREWLLGEHTATGWMG